MFQLNKFKSKLAELEMSVKDAAAIIGCNEVTLYRKMSGVSDFTRNEIQLLRTALKLTAKDVDDIFFA